MPFDFPFHYLKEEVILDYCYGRCNLFSLMVLYIMSMELFHSKYRRNWVCLESVLNCLNLLSFCIFHSYYTLYLPFSWPKNSWESMTWHHLFSILGSFPGLLLFYLSLLNSILFECSPLLNQLPVEDV